MPGMWTDEELSRIDLRGMVEFCVRARLTRTLSKVKSNCLASSTPYNITVDDLYPLPLTCPVLGMPLNWMSEGKGTANDHPTIDRLIPELGYTKGNVRIISNRANRLKGNASLDELQSLVRYMERHGSPYIVL